MINEDKFKKTIILYLLVFFLSTVFAFNFSLQEKQHFSLLAQSFLQGRTYFTGGLMSWADTVPSGSKYYWPLGPFPAVVLMPFVYLFSLFGYFFYQKYFHFLTVLAVFFLIFKIAQKYKYSYYDCLFWAFAFVFSTTFIGVAMLPWAWYLAHVVVVLLIFSAFYEFLQKRRYWLIGIILGAVLATRVNASFVIAFFILKTIFLTRQDNKIKLKNVFSLLVPYIVSGSLLALYNFIRFGSFLEQGYLWQLIPSATAKAREYGLFSLTHLPGNLYYFLLSSPLPVFKDGLSHVLTFPFIEANPWGMSVFVTSPIFVYLFLFKYKDKFSRLLLLTTLLIALPIFLYYGIGFRQFGYRYSLDFLPLLFILLIRSYREQSRCLSKKLKLLIVFSAFFNLYLFLPFMGGL